MTDAFNELFEERMRTIDARLKLNKLIALNLQLFNAIIAYAKSNSIPLTFNPRILAIVRQMEEEDLNRTKGHAVADEKKHLRGADEDETEPVFTNRERYPSYSTPIRYCLQTKIKRLLPSNQPVWLY